MIKKKKVTSTVKKVPKEKVLLIMPSKPKSPKKVGPKSIWEVDYERSEKLLDEMEDVILPKLGWKKESNYWGELGWVDPDGDGYFNSDDLRTIATMMDEQLVVLPGIEGTKTLKVQLGYDIDFQFDAKLYPKLEDIAAKNKAYEKRLEKYEKDMIIYNSEASKKARAIKEAEANKRIEAKLAAKRKQLEAEEQALLKRMQTSGKRR